MTRTVFDNHGVAHVWAQGEARQGRSNNGNFYFEGPALYSYGRHYLAGFLLPDGVALLNGDSSSMTTNGKHKPAARRAVTHREAFTLPALSDLDSALHWAAAQGGDSRVIPSRYYDRQDARREVRAWAVKHARAVTQDALAYVLGLAGLSRSLGAVMAEHDRRAQEAEKRRAQEAEARAQAQAERLAGPSLSLGYFDPVRSWDSALREAVSSAAAGVSLGNLARDLLRAQKWAKGRRGWKKRHEVLKARRAQVRAILGNLEARQGRAYANRETRRAVSALRPDNLAHVLAGGAIPHAVADYIGGGGKDAQAPDAAQEGQEVAALMAARALARLVKAGPVPVSVKARAQEALDRLAPVAEAARQARAERVEAAAQAREAERLERERETREAWLAGDTRVRFWATDAQGGAYLRAVDVERDDSGNITGGELQTSQGARVPLVHALRVFRFLKHCRETGRTWERNGRTLRVGFYQVDRVDADGTFKAGCHLIRWPQVEALAARLGVADLEAQDVTERTGAAA